MLTGSHHMQAYWVPSKYGNLQYSLPFTYVFADQRWVPRNDGRGSPRQACQYRHEHRHVGERGIDGACRVGRLSQARRHHRGQRDHRA